MDKLRKEGYVIVTRSSGSRSKIDVIGIRPGEIRFIQSKPKSMSDNAKKKILDELSWLNGEFFGRWEVI